MQEQTSKIIDGMPAEEYLALKMLSRSTLWHMHKSPWHFERATRIAVEETRPMFLGTAYHTLVLEPDAFEERYRIDTLPEEPKVDKRTKVGKAMIAEWQALCDELIADMPIAEFCKRIITREEFAMLTQMAYGVRQIPQFQAAMRFDPKMETTLLWTDKLTDIECKARIDIWTPGSNVVMDLKTIDDLDNFKGHVGRYGYHLQDAMYARGIEEITGELPPPMLFIVSEKQEPYASQVFMLDDDSRERSLWLFDDLICKVDKHARMGEWPRGAEGITPIHIPPWGF